MTIANEAKRKLKALYYVIDTRVASSNLLRNLSHQSDDDVPFYGLKSRPN